MDLKELLGEELFTQVQAKLGNDTELLVNNKKESNYIPKSRFDSVLGQKKVLSDKIDNLEIQLEEMKGDVANVETMKTQLQQAQDDIVQAKQEVTNVKKQAEIKYAIAQSGAKKTELVAKLLIEDKITIKDDGTIEGLEEQIKALKTEVPELFTATPQANNQGGNGGGTDPNKKPNDEGGETGEKGDNTQIEGGTGSPGNGGAGGAGKTESIGAKLAKKKASAVTQVDYFK